MKTLRELLTCDVSFLAIEQRPRVQKPKGAKWIASRVVAPNDDNWLLYRAVDGSAYYTQKEPDWWHKPPWKKTEWVKLTPAEAIAWVADLSGNPQIRRDALRQLTRRIETLNS